MNKRLFTYLLLIGLLLSVGLVKAQESDVTLVMWVMGSETPNMVEYMDTIATEFEGETGIGLEYEFIPWADAVQRISTAVASGEGPDVTQAGTTRVASFQATGGFVDLTDDFGSTLPPSDAFVPSAMATSGYSGRSYSMPWITDPRAMVFRRDLWEEAGYPDGPETWEELRDGALKIKEAHPDLTSVIGLPGQDFGHFLGSFVWQNCADVVSEDGSEVTWDNPAVAETVKYFADLMAEDNTVAPQNSEWNQDDMNARLWNGEIAVAFVGPPFRNNATPEQIEAMSDLLVVRPHPVGPAGCNGNFVGGSNLMIFQDSDHIEESKQLLAFLARPEIQALRTQITNDAPAIVEAFEAPALEEGFWPGFAEAAAVGRHFVIHPAWSDIQQTIPTVLTNLYASVIEGNYEGEQTITQILSEVDQEAQRALDAAGGAPEDFSNVWPTP